MKNIVNYINEDFCNHDSPVSRIEFFPISKEFMGINRNRYIYEPDLECFASILFDEYYSKYSAINLTSSYKDAWRSLVHRYSSPFYKRYSKTVYVHNDHYKGTATFYFNGGNNKDCPSFESDLSWIAAAGEIFRRGTVILIDDAECHDESNYHEMLMKAFKGEKFNYHEEAMAIKLAIRCATFCKEAKSREEDGCAGCGFAADFGTLGSWAHPDNNDSNKKYCAKILFSGFQLSEEQYEKYLDYFWKLIKNFSKKYPYKEIDLSELFDFTDN